MAICCLIWQYILELFKLVHFKEYISPSQVLIKTPTLILLPRKSHGRRNLVGCSPWGRKESDTTDFTFTFHFHALEKEMATHSSVLAWRIPGAAEPGGLPSMGSHRVGDDWRDLAAAAAAAAAECSYSLYGLCWNQHHSDHPCTHLYIILALYLLKDFLCVTIQLLPSLVFIDSVLTFILL